MPQTSPTDPIGLIGIGLVGTALAEHLLDAGLGVVGYDIEPGKCEHLQKLGGAAAQDAANVGQRCRRVLLSLMTTDIVRDVVEGPSGLVHAEAPPEIIIDTTTGDPHETIALAERLAERGIAFLDATISGSSEQIRQREAVFMVGGDREAFDACSDLFAAVADKAVYLGPSGSGSKAKLASNLVLGLNRLALAEGLIFAERLGLDLEAFLALLKMSPAYSVAMDVKGEKMLKADFTPQSKVEQHHKDVTTILEYASKCGQELPLTAAHLEVLESLIRAGHGESDNAAVVEEIRRRCKGV